MKSASKKGPGLRVSPVSRKIVPLKRPVDKGLRNRIRGKEANIIFINEVSEFGGETGNIFSLAEVLKSRIESTNIISFKKVLGSGKES